MMNEIQSKTIGAIAICAAMIGASIYIVMITVTLPHLEAISGHVPFDMRPFGYGYADAIELLNGLGAEGRTYYLTRQLPLDTVYPAMLALTLVATVSWFAQRMANGKLVRVAIAVSISCALFDYSENFGIAAMLLSDIDVSTKLVYAASFATVAKSALTTLAVVLILAVGVVWARQPKPVMP